jgi:hypothetical protein
VAFGLIPNALETIGSPLGLTEVKVTAKVGNPENLTKMMELTGVSINDAADFYTVVYAV